MRTRNSNTIAPGVFSSFSPAIGAISFGVLMMLCFVGSSELVAQVQGSNTKIRKSDQQWKQQLTADEYYVTRQKGTEQPYTGKLWNNKKPGTYTCKCCGQALFDSKSKFESGTGWPSYFQPINGSAISNVADRTAGMVRTETVCSRCDAHLGHVFDDGPKPTGLRYCMNSVSLGFVPAAAVGVARPKAAVLNPVANNGYGFESAQKLVSAFSIAVAENSVDKFKKCTCWSRLPSEIQAKLNSQTGGLPVGVTSMSLRPEKQTTAAGLEFNIPVSGSISLGFKDTTKNRMVPYGVYNGRYYIAMPIKLGSLSGQAPTTSPRR